MRKAYNEIMEEIQVDDEMRGRILRHLAQEMDAGSQKAVAKRRWRQLVPLAACLTVLLTGSILLQSGIRDGYMDPYGFTVLADR